MLKSLFSRDDGVAGSGRGGQPGLTGGSDDTYVQHLTRRATSQGWAVVVFNSRGCADSPVSSAQVSQRFSQIFLGFAAIVVVNCAFQAR